MECWSTVQVECWSKVQGEGYSTVQEGWYTVQCRWKVEYEYIDGESYSTGHCALKECGAGGRLDGVQQCSWKRLKCYTGERLDGVQCIWKRLKYYTGGRLDGVQCRWKG